MPWRPGDFRCGYHHFLNNGIAELRLAGPSLDLQWYIANNATVGADLTARRARDAFTHYLCIGLSAGLVGAPPPPPPAAGPDLAAILYRARAGAAAAGGRAARPGLHLRQIADSVGHHVAA